MYVYKATANVHVAMDACTFKDGNLDDYSYTTTAM